LVSSYSSNCPIGNKRTLYRGLLIGIFWVSEELIDIHT
jgi:hypothetical protein